MEAPVPTILYLSERMTTVTLWAFVCTVHKYTNRTQIRARMMRQFFFFKAMVRASLRPDC